MLETHVTNLEQSRKLYALGFRKDYIFFRRKTDDDQRYLCSKLTHNTEEQYDTWAYLLSEIMEALPTGIGTSTNTVNFIVNKHPEGYYYRFVSLSDNGKSVHFVNQNPVTAACDLRIWCRENGFISTK